jgi:RecB family exonuclease
MYRDGDKRAGALFRVYAEAFKGKRQLVWSKGLKALFCVEDISDEALAERDEEDAQWVYGLTPLDWKAIIYADARAQILEAYESSGKEEVYRVLVILRRDYLIHQSTFQTGPK